MNIRNTTLAAVSCAIAVFMADGRVARTAPANAGPANVDAAAWVPAESKSEKPTGAEWDAASPLALLRPYKGCSAVTLREWVRVSCGREPSDDSFLGIRVIGGPHEDVWIVDPPKSAEKGDRGVQVIFPMRRGDRRLIELAVVLPLAWRAWDISEDVGLMISAAWLSDEPAPVIVLH